MGLTAWFLRHVDDARAQRALLIGSLVFNLAELFAQPSLRRSGLASQSIWGPIVGHAIGAILCRLALRRGTRVRAKVDPTMRGQA